MTYRVITRHGSVGIQCLLCGLISYHPMDIREKYCARCHLFHEG